MNHSRLILVEGIPGSGKTSTANFIQKWLDEHGFANRLFLEGDLDHPADYESVAYFSRPEYAQFLIDHEASRLQLEGFSSFRRRLLRGVPQAGAGS
jgi:tRNA uridine 5-carbamoylmethylation protein Kti12